MTVITRKEEKKTEPINILAFVWFKVNSELGNYSYKYWEQQKHMNNVFFSV
jgi:hypothetical protein